MEIIAKRIKMARLNRGHKMIELERLMGIPRSNISRWERNLIMPSIENIIKLAKALGVSVGWLLGEGGELANPKFISFKGIKEGAEDLRRIENLVIERIWSSEEDGIEITKISVGRSAYIKTTESINEIYTKLRKVGLMGEVIK